MFLDDLRYYERGGRKARAPVHICEFEKNEKK